MTPRASVIDRCGIAAFFLGITLYYIFFLPGQIKTGKHCDGKKIDSFRPMFLPVFNPGFNKRSSKTSTDRWVKKKGRKWIVLMLTWYPKPVIQVVSRTSYFLGVMVDLIYFVLVSGFSVFIFVSSFHPISKFSSFPTHCIKIKKTKAMKIAWFLNAIF